MQLNNYPISEEKEQKIGNTSSERVDPEYIFQKLKEILDYLQNSKLPLEK